MKQMTLREANQGFSRIVREIEETGETVQVLRNGKPAVEIGPARETRPARALTDTQRRAIAGFLKTAETKPGNSGGQTWSRDSLHER